MSEDLSSCLIQLSRWNGDPSPEIKRIIETFCEQDATSIFFDKDCLSLAALSLCPEILNVLLTMGIATTANSLDEALCELLRCGNLDDHDCRSDRKLRLNAVFHMLCEAGADFTKAEGYRLCVLAGSAEMMSAVTQHPCADLSHVTIADLESVNKFRWEAYGRYSIGPVGICIDDYVKEIKKRQNWCCTRSIRLAACVS
jgi:hypothetical protein